MLPRKSFLFIFGTLIILFIWAASHIQAQGGDVSPFTKASQLALPSESYQWGNVAIGGGGYVTGLVIHPTEAELLYIRTDVGGVYRWLPEEEGWKPLTDGFGMADKNFYGVDSLALDPTVTDTLYIAAGKYL